MLSDFAQRKTNPKSEMTQCNVNVILHQATEFRPNRSTLPKYDVMSIFQDGGRGR